MTCRYKGCKTEEHARGLCKKHYDEAWKLKLRDPKAYAVLVKSGVILPPYAKGRELAALADKLAKS